MKVDIAQLEFIDIKLRKMVLWLASIYPDEPVITSLYRIGDSGVHGVLPLRGIDIRCRDDEIGMDIQRKVNETWLYDTSRPRKHCCVYHDVGLGKHLHLQVHQNTIRK